MQRLYQLVPGTIKTTNSLNNFMSDTFTKSLCDLPMLTNNPNKCRNFCEKRIKKLLIPSNTKKHKSTMNTERKHLDSDCNKPKFTQFRHWTPAINQLTQPMAQTKTNGTKFTLMSYNVLAQDLLECHSYLYRSHHQSDLAWDKRFERLCQEILYFSPHILCLQEVQQSHLPQYVDKFKQLQFDGYIFKKRTGSGQTDGCAIFFNSDIFELIEEQTVEYYQPNVELLDRQNVAIIAKLALKRDRNTCLVVATTHLLYNRRRQDVRLAQIQVLLAEIDRLSLIGRNNGILKYAPIILTGDFNLEPFSAPYNLITQGKLHYEHLSCNTLEEFRGTLFNQQSMSGKTLLPIELGITDFCQHVDLIKYNLRTQTKLHHSERKKDVPTIDNAVANTDLPFQTGTLRHKLNLCSVYANRENASTFQDKWIVVDYIFYSKDYNSKKDALQENSLKMLEYFQLPKENNCLKIGRIPNRFAGSDHLSLVANFELMP